MIKRKIKQYEWAHTTYALLSAIKQFFQFKPLVLIKQSIWFYKEFKKYQSLERNDVFQNLDWHPCLNDNLSYTPLDPTYFFQDSWAAKHIFESKPVHHYDIGSSAKTMGILSQFVPVTMVDIRPIELELDNFFFKKGSILCLPFDNQSILSLSSMCVVEHIGLGRYGDSLNQFGSEDAIAELKRVLKVGGVLLFSVPIDKVCKVYFNAHRAFTRDYILELFEGFEVLDEKYHYGYELFNEYDPKKGFGTGLYKMKKVK